MTEIERLREALEATLFCLEIDHQIKHPEWDGSVGPASAIGKARAALAATPPGAERWMPIESAPRDGTEILTVGLDCAERAIATRWFDPGPYVRTEHRSYHKDAGFYWAGYDGAVGPIRPTHWQPLPAPPSPPASEGEK